MGQVGPAGTRVTGNRRIAKLALAALAAASAAVLVSGCSSDMTAYPAVHDMPAARTETTLTPDQVKQATQDLMSERDRTEAQAQPAVQPVSASNAPATTGSIPQKKSTASAQPAAQQSASGVSAYARQ